MKALLACVTFLLCTSTALAAPKPIQKNYSTAKVLQVADTYLTVREKTNRNDHPSIDKFLKYVGLAPGNPYCLAFDVYSWGQVYKKKNPFPKVGGTIYFIEYAEAHPLRYKIYKAKDVKRATSKELKAGIGIFQHSTTTGHAVLVRSKKDASNVNTIEGNTIVKNTKNAAEQRGQGKTKNKQGVYYRTRSVTDSGMKFRGIVVPR